MQAVSCIPLSRLCVEHVKHFKLFEHRYPPAVARQALLFEIVIERKLTRNVELRAGPTTGSAKRSGPRCNARLLVATLRRDRGAERENSAADRWNFSPIKRLAHGHLCPGEL